MDPTPQKSVFAWQPITPAGVAAFARASFRRLFLVYFVVALATSIVTVWFLLTAWSGPVRQAIQHLPADSAILWGELSWAGASPVKLAENRFLGFAVDLRHVGGARTPSHVHVEFGARDVRVYSLLGYASWPYSRTRSIAFSHSELGPWWGAWSPALLAIAAAATLAGMMIVWLVLATIYWLPVWLVAFYGNREINASGSWKLAAAALVPGALIMDLGIVLYGLCILDLVRLALILVLHFVVGWVCLVAAPLSLPRSGNRGFRRRNPFGMNRKTLV